MSTTTTTTTTTPLARPRHGLGRVARIWHDTYAVAVRNLIAYIRVPQLLVFSSIQPVMFVLLWRYVFGGAVTVPGGVDYVDYLMPGIFVQTVVFGSLAAAIGLAADLKSGVLERFRSLPMAGSAVLTGRTFADLVRNVLVVTLMVIVGFMVGFHIHNGVVPFLGGLVLVILFGFTMAWVFAGVGLVVGDPESAQAAAFPILAPLVFASSAFVPVETMPSWLQAFARNQPVSVTVDAVRVLCLGGPAAAQVTKALLWMVVIILAAGPLSVHWYRKAV